MIAAPALVLDRSTYANRIDGVRSHFCHELAATGTLSLHNAEKARIRAKAFAVFCRKTHKMEHFGLDNEPSNFNKDWIRDALHRVRLASE